MIKDVLESGHLHPAMAGKLWERLGFSCTQMFGRFGRAKLRPFSRRQHEHRRSWLNHQLTSALKWWLEILSCSAPRVIPTKFVGASQNCLEKRWRRVGGGCWCSLMGKQVVLMTFLRSKRLVLWSCLRTSRNSSGVLCGFTFLTMRQLNRTWSMDRHPSSKETS